MAKSLVRERLEAVVTMFVARNFESIVRKLASLSDRLDAFAVEQQRQAAELRAAATRLDFEADAKSNEARRAERVAAKLNDLLS